MFMKKQSSQDSRGKSFIYQFRVCTALYYNSLAREQLARTPVYRPNIETEMRLCNNRRIEVDKLETQRCIFYSCYVKLRNKSAKLKMLLDTDCGVWRLKMRLNKILLSKRSVIFMKYHYDIKYIYSYVFSENDKNLTNINIVGIDL